MIGRKKLMVTAIGRRMFPLLFSQNGYILIPETYESVRLPGKRKLCLQVELRLPITDFITGRVSWMIRGGGGYATTGSVNVEGPRLMLWLWGWGWGAMSQEMRVGLDAGKVKEMSSPKILQKECQPWRHLDLSPWDLDQTSDPLSSKLLKLCCFGLGGGRGGSSGSNIW